jgi:hypothetical protein
MKKLKGFLTFILTTTFILISIGIFVNSISTDVEARKPCSNDRCDFRHGQSYGCSLTAAGKSCAYTGGVCTGYTTCGVTSE